MSTARHPYLDWPGPIAFAHRGGTSEHPENTLPAFAHAVDLGYNYLETDVHLSADGVLVAFHDSDLARTCGHPGKIDELTWDELAEFRVEGRQPIPLMSELLEAFPAVRFNIDCKSDTAVAPLTELLQEFDALDRVCVGSFSHRRLRTLRNSVGDRLLTCMSPQEVASLRLAGRVGSGARQVAQVPLRTGGIKGLAKIEIVNERFIRNAHEHHIPVHVWTVNDRSEMNRLLDLKVDGIMTDEPELLRDVLVERDEWNTPSGR